MMPVPSLKLVPLPSASKVRVLPSGLYMPPSLYTMPLLKGTVSAMPPASAMSHSPSRSALKACAIATSEVLHAVCMLNAGPRRSNSNARRVAM